MTRIAWGDVWGDPSLPWKTRSLLTLAMMTALHREEEFKVHFRAARRNGVSDAELRAALTQAGIYAGVPAGNAAFRWAVEVMAETAD
jgi:3-oxoadipate enol-lactonase/4-carboxymuconolactone decarboxylase